MIKAYLRLAMFSFCLLFGVQIPNFIDQYQKRVNAHLDEVNINFSKFQKIANKHFSGNVDALISHYQASKDTVVKDSAQTVEELYQRKQSFQKEADILGGFEVFIFFHILSRSNSPLFQETVEQYSYSFPLNLKALGWGILFAFAISTCVEFLVSLLLESLFKKRRLLKRHVPTV